MWHIDSVHEDLSYVYTWSTFAAIVTSRPIELIISRFQRINDYITVLVKL